MTWKRKNRPKEVHLLNEDGMVACNPRDKEAVHRAEMGDISVTEDFKKVTCKKCLFPCSSVGRAAGC